MSQLPAHIWPDTAAIVDGQLQIGGCDTVALAAAHGTPLYLLDEATVRGAMRAYQQAFSEHYPGEYRVHYASKALLTTALARIVAEEGLGLDAVSGTELLIARRAGLPLERVHLHGNAKTSAELERAIEWEVGAVVVDTFDELAQLAALSAGRERPQGVLLRVAPGIDAHTHAHIATGGADSKFGLPLGGLAAAAELVLDAPGLHLLGLHAHIGSQLFDGAAITMAVEVLVAQAAMLRDRYDYIVEEISPGGGLGVPYTADMPATNIAAYAEAVAQAMRRAATAHALPLPRLTIEPGRSIVARAGVALYSVVGRKDGGYATAPDPGAGMGRKGEAVATPPASIAHDPGAVVGRKGEAVATPPASIAHDPGANASPLRYIHIDGGMADNIRPALYGAVYTAMLANRAAEPPTTTYHVAGRYCESGDVLLRDAPLPAAGPGDLLAVAVAGAYTLSMASTYNMVPRPPLLLVGNGQARVIVRRETEEDLLARES